MTAHDGSMDWPNIEKFSEAPVFNTKAVVQQTGIPAPTLRAWERRYALLSPERADNTYRLYSERDICLIRWLKGRIDEGMAISQAIALFRHLSEERQRQQNHLTQQHDNSTFQFSGHGSQQVQEEDAEDEQSSIENSLVQNPYQQNSYVSTNNLHTVSDHLIEIFQNLDEQTAHIIMGSMFSLYPLEQICTDLITPTLWKIGQMWAEGRLTVSVEHFATNFFRALLTNRFYITQGPLQGPLVITACSPNEIHELAPLMLSLFLRRGGLRVAFLGQSIETTGLLHTIRKLQPALICLSLTMRSHLPELISLGKRIESMPQPHPLLVFGGQIFAQDATIITEIPGSIYVEGDLKSVTIKLRKIVTGYAMEKKA